MVYIYIIISIILFIVFYYYYSDLNSICNNLEYFRYNSTKSGENIKTILILGGIHGNEPAGSVAIYKLMDDLNNNVVTSKHRLILIPYVNYCALQLNVRSMIGIGDLNRKFPNNKNYNDDSLHPIIKQILLFVNEADIVLDFHEGWGFYKDLFGSIGSTITPSNTEESLKFAEIIYEKLNATINEPKKKFTILVNKDNLLKDNNKYGKNREIKNTLISYINLINKDYLLIETSGQKNVQDAIVRINQFRIIIDYFINL